MMYVMGLRGEVGKVFVAPNAWHADGFWNVVLLGSGGLMSVS